MLLLRTRLASLSAMGQRASAPLSMLRRNHRAAPPPPRSPRSSPPPPNAGLPPLASSPPVLSDEDLSRVLGQPLSRAPMAPPPRPLVLVVSGPSGVGKDAVLQRLRARRPNLRFVVTATTRERRPGETDGVDYHFVSRPQFEAWIERGELLEHALVYGEYKGIPRAQVDAALAAGEDVVLRIDVQGAATVRRMLAAPAPGAWAGAGRGTAAASAAASSAPSSTGTAAARASSRSGAGPAAGAAGVPLATVFLVAESQAALARRLAARGTEDPEALRRRFREAEAECARLGEFDYVITNREGRIDECVDALAGLIDAHRARVAPVASATTANKK
jgi:guanylate kinase